MTNPTRQIGEGGVSSPFNACCYREECSRAFSDLEQITRQRDEAVRLLRPFAEQAPAREGRDDWSITTTVVKYLRDAAAFLATVENHED